MSNSNPQPNRLKKGFKETVLLLRTIPSVVVALFVISVITMNLLANKTLSGLGIQQEYPGRRWRGFNALVSGRTYA